MKKIFSLIMSFFLLSVLIVGICGAFLIFEGTEPKHLNIDDTRIVESKIIPKPEQEMLDSNLKENQDVLLLYYETDEELNDEKEELIIREYTKEIVPYVIFAYNPKEQTLKTFSSNKEMLDFNDISLENVTSYTEIYKYLPEINSKVMVTIVSQNRATLVLYICGMIYIALLASILIFSFIRYVSLTAYWQGKSRRYLYKEGFWEKGYKVKINAADENVVAMYSNVPIEKGKDYFYISKKQKKKNKIVIETEYEFIVYEPCELFLIGLSCKEIILKFKSNDSKIQKIKSEYKYYMKK